MTTERTIPEKIRKTYELSLADIEKADGELMRAVITAEIADAEGDVVEVGGIEWPRYNAENPLPVLSSHLRKLPDGKPPIVGFATKLYRGETVADGKRVPAVFMEWEWAETELAHEWKSVYARAGRLSFSIGASVKKAEPIEKDGRIEGFRYVETELTEVSVVTIPANPSALSARESTKAIEDMTENLAKQITEALNKQESLINELASSLDAIETRIDELATSKTVAANEADERNETTSVQPSSIELSEKLTEILQKVKSMKSTECSSDGNQRDTKQSDERD